MHTTCMRKDRERGRLRYGYVYRADERERSASSSSELEVAKLRKCLHSKTGAVKNEMLLD